MAICLWALLEEPWDGLGTWTDSDNAGAVSSIDPAGELYLDCRAMTGNGYARRIKDIGTIGTGDYTVYIRFKGDVWDGQGTAGAHGLRFITDAGTSGLVLLIANDYTDDGGTDGIWIFDGASYVKVLTKTWDTGWHTIRIDVHNSQTDADIYIDDETTPSVTDADCSHVTSNDGDVYVDGYGTVAGNGEYHIDYIKINAGICDPTATAAGSPMFFSGGSVFA